MMQNRQFLDLSYTIVQIFVFKIVLQSNNGENEGVAIMSSQPSVGPALRIYRGQRNNNAVQRIYFKQFEHHI